MSDWRTRGCHERALENRLTHLDVYNENGNIPGIRLGRVFYFRSNPIHRSPCTPGQRRRLALADSIQPVRRQSMKRFTQKVLRSRSQGQCAYNGLLSQRGFSHERIGTGAALVVQGGVSRLRRSGKSDGRASPCPSEGPSHGSRDNKYKEGE